MRLAGLAKGGYYPTPARVVELIAKRIPKDSTPRPRGRQTKTFRMLDPCCGKGNALLQLSNLIRYKIPHWPLGSWTTSTLKTRTKKPQLHIMEHLPSREEQR